MDAILSLITEENKPDPVMATHYFGQIGGSVHGSVGFGVGG